MKKVLIVDDEPDIAKMLGARLNKSNYDVAIAVDAAQGIKLAHEIKPDLIILDYMMPGGGVSVFENLKISADTSSIPVIFITAYPEKDIKNKVLQMGAVDFMVKPFFDEDIVYKVRKALGEEDQ